MAIDPNELRWAQFRIFNRLCVEYLRASSDAFLCANDLRKDLAIPEEIFVRVLLDFTVGDSSAVEITQSDGETYLRLGAAARYNCE